MAQIASGIKIQCWKKPCHTERVTQANTAEINEKNTLYLAKIISRPFVIVMESTLRLFHYTRLCGLENQTLTLSIYRDWLAEVYSHVSPNWVSKMTSSLLVLKLQMVWDVPAEHLKSIYLSNYLDTRASSTVRSSALPNDDAWAVRMTNTTAGPVSTC